MRSSFMILAFLAGFILQQPAASAQYTNRGTDFWVGYQRTNGFSQGNAQEMVIYLSAGNQQANVTITITGPGGTPWVKNYVVPANSAIVSDLIPKTGVNDARMQTEGYHLKQGIHITSDVPVAAYAHIYETTNSGATMLLPSSIWGYEYYTMNNRQNYAAAGGIPSATVFHVVAKEDSTWVEINPSKPTTNGWIPNGGSQPNGSYLVQLNKGDIYQVLGGVISVNDGQDLTGSSVKSVPNSTGIKKPIAVFSGSTRTGLGCGSSIGSSGDLIIQQMFPYELWGTKYATAPFTPSTNLAQWMTSIYRVMVKDVTTVVKRNGAMLPIASLVNGNYYQFESGTPDVITSDKPVLVAQYMASATSCPNTSGDGDPEMMFLTPTMGAIPQTSFFRTNKSSINNTYLKLVIPDAGIPSLKIDGVLYNNIPAADKISYPHPNFPGYTVITKKYSSGMGQGYVESNYAFTGYTYGIGSVESYGYNLGVLFDSVNVATVQYNTIRGNVFLDNNKNGIQDFNEPLYPLVKLQTMRPGIDTFNTYTYTGSFNISVDSGTYITSAKPFSPYYAAVPVTDTSYFPGYFASDSIGFAIQPIISVRDLAITMVATTPARPGFQASYKLLYVNKGTDTADAQISLAKSNKLNFVSSSVASASVTADTVKWNIASLLPGQYGEINVKFQLATPPQLNNGDTLRFRAAISSAKTDSFPADNTFSLAQRTTGSFDPNDKMESHGGQVMKSALNDGEALHYTIRFQNTGSDVAFNVVIRDTLDAKLDWNTLKMTGASHNYQLAVNDGRCAWSFNNINLVDSNTNEPLSHGYISFSIQPLPSVSVGNVISNKASIYFDHNLPVATNTVSTVVTQDVLPVTLLQFDVAKKQGYNLLEWRTAQQVNFSHFNIERSTNGSVFTTIGRLDAGKEAYSYIDNSFEKTVNFYRLKMVDKDGKFQYSPVRRVNNGKAVDIISYPNPAHDILYLRIESPIQKQLQFTILSADGRTLQAGALQAGAGITISPVSITSLTPGIYFMRIDSRDEPTTIIKVKKQ